MRYFTTLENDQIDSIAIGGFDGVHKAHQHLISKLSSNSLVLVIDKKRASLTPNTQRNRYINTGVCFIDYQKIKDLSSKEFVDFLLKRFKNLKKIVVGYDFKFGKDRMGDVTTLKKLFKHKVEVIEQIKLDDIAIHSRVIKELIKSGKIQKANRLLGRNYLIQGDVIKGLGIGKKSLYPTLNIKVEKFLIPKSGVYATLATINDKKLPSVTFIGHRLSVDNSFSIETHIVDIKKEIKIESLEIEFVKFLRENRKFSNLDELKKEISKDIYCTKQELNTFF